MLKAITPVIIGWIVAILLIAIMKSVIQHPTNQQTIIIVWIAVCIVCGGHRVAEHLDKKRRARSK